MAEGGVGAWVWIAIGFGGQSLFMMRFVIQWWSSERAGQVVIPVAFWYFSLAGGLVLTVYAIHRDDPVFIFGQALSLVIYARNLHLHYRGKGRSAAS